MEQVTVRTVFLTVWVEGLQRKGNTMEKKTITERFIARDESVLADVKEQYGQYCFSIARNMLSDNESAEECVNDALLAAWNSIPPNAPENFKAYIGKLVKRIAINRYKRDSAQKRSAEKTALPLEEMEEMLGDNDVEAHVESAELARSISTFLRGLKETERNVFVRRYWYRDPLESICKRYGFGKSKVKMMLKRTRDHLAEYLKKEGYFS